MRFVLLMATILSFTALAADTAHAQTSPFTSPAVTGTTGLNTVPSARMDESGTIRAGLTALDPYAHSYIGLQIAKPLYIGLRQTIDIKNTGSNSGDLHPGFDFKLRLLTESDYRPEISLGLQSAIGHKRMAGEFLAFSKRYKQFDFTAGIGWGRFGSAGQIDNPLKSIFGKSRPPDGNTPHGPDNWFSGDDAGLFAGLEYFPSFSDKLSLKLDWSADRYSAEKQAFGYDAPSPWGIGLTYKPKEWMSLGLALIGGEKIMGGLHLRAPLKQWPSRASHDALDTYKETVPVSLDNEGKTAAVSLALSSYDTAPRQIGHVLRALDNTDPSAEEFVIVPRANGIEGKALHILRRDITSSKTGQASAEEIWHHARFKDANTVNEKQKPLFHDLVFRLILDNRTGLSDEQNGILYRNAFITEGKGLIGKHLVAGAGFRLNIADNLHRIPDLRPRTTDPVRSDEDLFAGRTIALDRLFLGWNRALTKNIYASLTSGYLEEMFGGFGGELLYRPFGKTFALGAESYMAYKRDPSSALNTGFTGDYALTGFIKGWYEIPVSNITLHAKLGRFLAEDTGLSLSLQRRMDNDIYVEGFVTAINNADRDLSGGTSHLYGGVRLTLPIGNVKYLPAGSELRLQAAPFGRDKGQTLSAPLPLYETTEKLSYRHISRYWPDLLE